MSIEAVDVKHANEWGKNVTSRDLLLSPFVPSWAAPDLRRSAGTNLRSALRALACKVQLSLSFHTNTSMVTT